MTAIWLDENNDKCINIIDQRFLPFQLLIEQIYSSQHMALAISEMHLRGAPLIGVAAAYGMYLGIHEAKQEKNPFQYLNDVYRKLLNTRPTAVNLKYGIDLIMEIINKEENIPLLIEKARDRANKIREDEINRCKSIGVHGLEIIKEIFKKTSSPVNILTHCNAGWLACVDYGTATAPIYLAHQENIPIHVYVDETRPRNQGARLTAWELQQAGVPNTLIADNAGGHLMQNNQIDLVIVGSDRTTIRGNVYNKIGTYLKALAAYDNKIPFYAALPSSTFDTSDDNDIKIENRSEDEVHFVQGQNTEGNTTKVRISPHGSKALNPAFDCTPSHLITGLITEKGICTAKEAAIKNILNS